MPLDNDNKISNIIGAKIPQWVLEQLQTRSNQNTQDFRDNDNILYLANKSAWVRLVSSVNLQSEEDLVYFKQIVGDEIIKDKTSLAKNFVLFGGTSKYLNKNSYQLRSGLEKDGAYGILGDQEIKDFGYRPMPGISDVTIETQGRLGSIRGAIINFKCWDKYQLDIIDALYFKLGFTMLLEWGHTYFYPSSKNNKDRDPSKIMSTEFYSIDPFEENLTKEEIQIKIAKNSRDSEGNYDAMAGIVTNFNFSYNQEGGYDCTVRLMALGSLADHIKINNSGTLPALLEEEILKLNKTLIQIEEDRQAREASANAAANAATNPATTQPPPLKVEELINQYLKYDTQLNIYYGARVIYNSYSLQKISKADINILDTGYGDIFIIRKLGGFIPLRDDLLSQTKVFLDGQTFFSVLKETKIDLYNEKNIEYSDNILKQIFSVGTGLVAAVKEAFGGPDREADKEFPTREIKASYTSQNKLTYNIKIKSKLFATTTESKVEDIYYPVSDKEFIDQFTSTLNNSNNEYTISDLEVTDIIAQKGELSNDKVSITFKFNIPFTRTVNVIEKNQIDQQNLKALSDKITQEPVTFYLNIELTIEDTRFIKNFITPESVIQPIEFKASQNLTDQNQSQNTAAASAAKPNKPDLNAISTQIKQSLNYSSTLEIMLRTIQVHALNKAINKTGTPDLEIGRTTFVLDLTDTNDVINYKDVNAKDVKSPFLNQIFSTGVFSTFITDLVNNKISIEGYTTEKKMNPSDMFKIHSKYGFATSLLGNKAPVEKLEPVNFKELLKAYVVPYQINQEIIKGTPANHPVYISLGLLLMILNHACTIYDTKKDQFQTPLIYIDFNPELNFCLTNSKQLTTDPFTCLIPFEGNFEDFKSLFDSDILTKDREFIDKTTNSKETVKLFNPEKQDYLSGDLPKLKFDEQPIEGKSTKESGNVYRAKMMNILLDIDYLIRLVQQYSYKDGSNSVYLKTFIEQVLVDVNKSLGNFNVFRLSYNDSANTFQIVDDQVAPTLANEDSLTPRDNTTQLPLAGKFSIAKSLEIKSEISNRLSNMIAISSNSTIENKSTLSTNGDSVGFINTNYIDRYITDKLEITGSNDSKKNNDTIKIAAAQFNSSISDFYSKINPSPINVPQATNYYIEKMTTIKNKDYPTRASFMIPVSVNFSTDGISGLGMMQGFTIPEKLLPYTYSTRKTTGFSKERVNNVGFVVVGLTHTISNNQWNTDVKANMIFLKDSTEFVGDVSLVTSRKGIFGVNQANQSLIHGPINSSGGAGSRVPRGTDQTISLTSPVTSSFIFGSAKNLGDTIKLKGHGARDSNQVGQWQSENAWDLMVPAFTPVYAIFDGMITNLNFYEEVPFVWGYRFTLVGDKNTAFYTHLDRSIYQSGTTVKKGQLLGYVGKPPAEYTWPVHLHIALGTGNLSTYLKNDGTII